MPAKKHDDAESHAEKEERQRLGAKIGDQVMQALGQPRGFHGLQIRRLWQNHFRVNILVGVDILSAIVAHSYFVVVDGSGNIATSDPIIVRTYRAFTTSAPMAQGDATCPT